MAVLAAAGLRYDQWIRVAGKTIAVVTLAGAVAVVLAVVTKLT
jgi:hypothetical protein